MLKHFSLTLMLMLGFSWQVQGQEIKRQIPANSSQMTLSFAAVVEKTSPSVVNIYAKRRTRRTVPLFGGSLFQEFFQNFGLQNERLENSLGSGVVVDGMGLVISNLHVLQGAEDIVVVTHDRREYRAEIVLEDAQTDLAIIRLSNVQGKLQSLPFGDVYDAKVGDLVLAIGNPFGVSQTVTSGIISGLWRTRVNDNRYQSFIQTDAAINPGNSGGSLINTGGELLGINTAIISPTGSSSGLGFAIPVNMIKPIVYAAKNDVPLNRAWLGFVPEVVTTSSAEALGLPYPHGVLVGTVLADSPASRAGLRSGDLITRVNGHLIDNPRGLQFFVATLIPEHTPMITLDLLENKQQTRLDFPVEFPPVDPPMNRQVINNGSILTGSAVVNISPFVTERFNLPLGESGVLIQQVFPNSPARRLDFREGDILRRLNKTKISNVTGLLGLLEEHQQVRRWNVEVTRQGQNIRWQIQ